MTVIAGVSSHCALMWFAIVCSLHLFALFAHLHLAMDAKSTIVSRIAEVLHPIQQSTASLRAQSAFWRRLREEGLPEARAKHACLADTSILGCGMLAQELAESGWTKVMRDGVEVFVNKTFGIQQLRVRPPSAYMKNVCAFYSAYPNDHSGRSCIESDRRRFIVETMKHFMEGQTWTQPPQVISVGGGTGWLFRYPFWKETFGAKTTVWDASAHCCSIARKVVDSVVCTDAYTLPLDLRACSLPHFDVIMLHFVLEDTCTDWSMLSMMFASLARLSRTQGSRRPAHLIVSGWNARFLRSMFVNPHDAAGNTSKDAISGALRPPKPAQQKAWFQNMTGAKFSNARGFRQFVVRLNDAENLAACHGWKRINTSLSANQLFFSAHFTRSV